MNKFIIIFFIMFISASQSFAVNYLKIEPEYLKPEQSTSYQLVNETLEIIFSKIKPEINTKKYPKYFHDFTLIKDDGTQSKNYNYVKRGNTELIYAIDTNELKYIALTRPELQKCRIMYDYPSGKLHAVQIYVSNSEYFIFAPDGKYIDYSPYVKKVHEKVQKNWKVPPRGKIEILAKGKKDLLVQAAVTVLRNGNVKKIVILKSSKIKVLDDNAIQTIKTAGPFEKFPDEFFNDEIIITLNFNFSL